MWSDLNTYRGGSFPGLIMLNFLNDFFFNMYACKLCSWLFVLIIGIFSFFNILLCLMLWLRSLCYFYITFAPMYPMQRLYHVSSIWAVAYSFNTPLRFPNHRYCALTFSWKHETSDCWGLHCEKSIGHISIFLARVRQWMHQPNTSKYANAGAWLVIIHEGGPTFSVDGQCSGFKSCFKVFPHFILKLLLLIYPYWISVVETLFYAKLEK